MQDIYSPPISLDLSLAKNVLKSCNGVCWQWRAQWWNNKKKNSRLHLHRGRNNELFHIDLFRPQALPWPKDFTQRFKALKRIFDQERVVQIRWFWSLKNPQWHPVLCKVNHWHTQLPFTWNSQKYRVQLEDRYLVIGYTFIRNDGSYDPVDRHKFSRAWLVNLSQ